MKKRSRKLVSILLTLSLLAALLLPMAAPAVASTGYTALSKPDVADDDYSKLGTVIVEVPADALENGDSVIFSLPSGFKYVPDISTNALAANGNYTFEASVSGTVYLRVSAPEFVGGASNAVYNDNVALAFAAEFLDDNQFKVTINGNYSASDGEKAFLKIEMPQAYVDEGFSGDIKMTVEAPSGSGFPDGEVVVGTVTGGKVTISVMDTNTSNDDFAVLLRVKESRKGSLTTDSDSIELTLPSGFKWTTTSGDAYAKTSIWGDNLKSGNGANALKISVDEDELKIGLQSETNSATCFEIELKFTVDDEDKAEMGDVKVEVDGEADLSPSELVVGTYGDWGATIKADGDIPEVMAGKSAEDAADIVVKESMKGSLLDGRTVLLTLPEFARWKTIKSSDTDNGVKLTFVEKTGTDDRTAKFKVSGESTDAAELTIEDIELDLQSNVTGDVKVTVSGSAGLTGEIVIAKVVPAAKIEVAKKTQLQIGKGNQELGDITITELKAGAFKEGSTAATSVKIDLNEGISFASTPKVEVVSGDIKLGEIYRVNSAELTKDNQLCIEIDQESDVPSAIKISGIKVNVDRTVPEGSVLVALVGGAVNETGGADGTLWPNSRVAAAVVGAEVVTPAPGEAKANAAFVIGSTTYKLNGVDTTMDAAPYIKDGRTYLPLRYVAQSLGVADANILWDGATKKVTLIKGTTFVQLTIGSNILMVNGMPITMDVAPEITSDRTCLPIRFVAQVLGATVGWDEATQTVTLK